jgi:hypothetical protein
MPRRKLPGAVDVLIGVVAAHAVLAERRRQAVDLVPVELDPRRDDQVVVVQPTTVAGAHDVVLGLELRHRVAQPHRARRDQPGLVALGRLLGRRAAADQRPQRLVVVLVRGLDDADVGLVEGAAEAGRDRDAGRASADDDNGVVLAGIHGLLLAAGLQRAFRGEIVAIS